MALRTLLPFLFLASAEFAIADFVPDDRIASDPGSDLPQPEFDRATNRIVWQDRQNRLWVGHVDPLTGALDPVNGRGQLVDSGLASTLQVGTTPRYTYGGDQAAIVYTKMIDGHFHLAKAVEVAPNTWQATLLENGEDRWHPDGTPEETTTPAMIVYNQVGPKSTVVSWRELDDPASERTVEVLPKGGRFLGSEPAVLLLCTDGNGHTQVCVIPFDTGQLEQITFGDEDNQNPFVWWAPEYQDYIFTVMVNFAQLAFYLRIDGVWTTFLQIVIQSGKPLLSSPEAIVVDGQSYIVVVSCDELGSGRFPGQPVGPSQIWLTGIDPAHPFFRRIDDPSYAAQRSEPEPYLLDTGPVVYYTESEDTGLHLVKRAKTGLTDDTDADGVVDETDNCVLVPNRAQRDTNGDGFGNLCDADLNGDCIVDTLDVAQMRSVMFTPDPDADLDGNGVVGPSDAIRLRQALGLPPGPSGATNACSGVQSDLDALRR
jgi:hypothetical protein